jgi:hypothetical protein
MQTKSKTPTEEQTRAAILKLARESGVEEQALKIMSRYDDALKGAKDEFQRHHLAAMGAAELHKLVGAKGPLVVDGVQVLPGQPGWEQDAEKQKSVIKMD